MMKYVKQSAAPYYLMLTECGLVGRLQVEAPVELRKVAVEFPLYAVPSTVTVQFWFSP